MKHVIRKTITSLFFLILFSFESNALAKDITQLIVNHSNYNEHVNKACQEYCLGNKSQGKIKRVIRNKIDENHFEIETWVSLKNHHYQAFLELDIYNYTVELHGVGKIDKRTCMAKVEKIDILNNVMKLDIESLIQDSIGKSYKIENCAKFL